MAARQRKLFGAEMECHSPSATAIPMLIKCITTRMHTSWKMCPLVARDSRLVGAAPLAIIKAAGKDGFVLIARPCRSMIRFLWVIQYVHYGSRGSVIGTHRRGVSGLSGFGHSAAYGKDVAGEGRRAGEVLDAFWRSQRRHFYSAKGCILA